MNSNNSLFDIFILDPSTKKEITFFLSKDKKYYVCTEPNQPFIIKLQAKDKTIVYGSKLYLDGKLAINYKTFKGSGHFLGFKLGNGFYKEFLFDVPPTKEVSEINENNELGSLKIEFYLTYSKIVENRDKNDNIYKEYSSFGQSFGTENKKFYLRSLSIREGNEFSITKNQNYHKNHCKTRTDDFIDFNKLVDSLSINYADFVALQIMGLISVRNLEHLYLIPEHKWDLNYAILSLEAILGNKKYNKEGINLKEVEEIFEKYTSKKLKSFVECDFYNFFQMKSNKFTLEDNGNLKLADRELFKKKFCEIPNVIDKTLYCFSNNKNDIVQYSNLKNKRNREEKIIIKIDD